MSTVNILFGVILLLLLPWSAKSETTEVLFKAEVILSKHCKCEKYEGVEKASELGDVICHEFCSIKSKKPPTLADRVYEYFCGYYPAGGGLVTVFEVEPPPFLMDLPITGNTKHNALQCIQPQ